MIFWWQYKVVVGMQSCKVIFKGGRNIVGNVSFLSPSLETHVDYASYLSTSLPLSIVRNPQLIMGRGTTHNQLLVSDDEERSDV